MEIDLYYLIESNKMDTACYKCVRDGELIIKLYDEDSMEYFTSELGILKYIFQQKQSIHLPNIIAFSITSLTITYRNYGTPVGYKTTIPQKLKYVHNLCNALMDLHRMGISYMSAMSKNFLVKDGNTCLVNYTYAVPCNFIRDPVSKSFVDGFATDSFNLGLFILYIHGYNPIVRNGKLIHRGTFPLMLPSFAWVVENTIIPDQNKRFTMEQILQTITGFPFYPFLEIPKEIDIFKVIEHVNKINNGPKLRINLMRFMREIDSFYTDTIKVNVLYMILKMFCHNKYNMHILSMCYAGLYLAYNLHYKNKCEMNVITMRKNLEKETKHIIKILNGNILFPYNHSIKANHIVECIN